MKKFKKTVYFRRYILGTLARKLQSFSMSIITFSYEKSNNKVYTSDNTRNNLHRSFCDKLKL